MDVDGPGTSRVAATEIASGSRRVIGSWFVPPIVLPIAFGLAFAVLALFRALQ